MQFNDSILPLQTRQRALQLDDITTVDEKATYPSDLMPIEFQRIDKDGGVTNRAVASWSRGEGGFTASFEGRYRIDRGTFKNLTPQQLLLRLKVLSLAGR